MNSKSAIITIKDLIAYHQKKKLLNSNEEFDKIPLYHSTIHKNFSNHVLKNNSLNANPDKCKVFGEKLLYFFYGKAEYWPKKDQEAVFKAYPPITMGFSIKSLKNYVLKRVYPFDTGGYDARRYLNEMDIADMGNYELNPNLNGIASFIELFYGTIENYILIEKKLKFELDDFSLCISAKLLDSLHAKVEQILENNNFGEQAFAIETQYDNPEIIDDPEVIFVPEYLFRTKVIDAQINETFPKTKIVKYACRQKQNITVKYNSMREAVIQYSLSKT